MTAKNKANFIVDLSGNVTQKAKAMGSAIASMGEKGSRSMRLFTSATNMSNNILDKFDNKLVGFASGGGLVMMAKRVGDWQQQLTELGTRYNMTTEQVAHFDQTVYNTAAAYKMPYADVVTAMDKILERTNDVSGSLSNIDNIAQAIKGLGLNAEDAGKNIGILMNKGFTSESVNKLLNGVASASKVGTGNINEQFAGLIDLTNGTQWQSPEQMMQLLAIQRMSDADLGNSTQAASAMQSFNDLLKDKDKQWIMRKNGVEVYKDKNKGIFKDPADLLMEIGNAANFKEWYLSSVFGDDLVKVTQSFKDKDKQKQLLGGINIEDGLLEDKTSRNINTFNGALTSLTNAGERWAQLKLAKPIQDLADAINSLTPEQLEDYTEKLETGVKVIGGAVAARYLYRGYNKAKDMFGGGKGGLGGSNPLESAAASATGATPVYVTNWGEQQSGGGGNSDNSSDEKSKIKTGMPLVDKYINFATQVYETSRLTEKDVDNLPDDHVLRKVMEIEKREQEDPLSFYDEGNSPTWMNAISSSFDNGVQNLGQTLNNAFATMGESMMLQSQIYMPTPTAEQVAQPNIPIQPSEIVLKIESADGLMVRTKSIQASDTDIVVNTGKTYGGAGY